MHLLRAGSRQGFSGDPDCQHQSVLLTSPGSDIFARRERVTVRIVLSAAMIVGGVVLLAL